MWRMPTDEEWTELRTKCTWTWKTNYNVTGAAASVSTGTQSDPFQNKVRPGVGQPDSGLPCADRIKPLNLGRSPRIYGYRLVGIKIYPYLCCATKLYFLFGLRFFFYSDEHLPMHVHVKNGDGKAKINIETAEVVENTGIKPADLKKAVDAVKQYKADMIKAWNEYFDEN